ncbi:ASCH domain-containing protein [Gaoshiqia sediminis]|uniref:ASCH domain-containing protein n=1 Tax=Gaoshiqia sediminis TaxID=2986998 RepID=A0AA41YCM8_9BACT|nr:ASCH domain-containing protein [Gaoshiqia sediminis]MCW0484088.1 ASCH domain-containing protein [Gaoshiqia sediminis]
MKTITIKQPWAHLICSGFKDIENRTWRTNFRGRVLIHAGANDNYKRSMNLLFSPEQWEYMRAKGGKNLLNYMFAGNWNRSAIIGSVEIVDCVQNHPSIWAEKGVWNWVLANPVLFSKPIEKVKGKLSFWDYPMTEDEYMRIATI